MAIEITLDDLVLYDTTITPDKADALITGALARAGLIAPCLAEAEFGGIYADAAKSVLVQTILRWHQTKPGVTSEAIGPFATSYGAARELFWPSELEELQNICGSYRSGVEGSVGDTSIPDWYFPPVEESPEVPNWVSSLVDP